MTPAEIRDESPHKGIVIDALQYSNWNRARLEELRAGGLTAIHATIVYHERARETLSAIAGWNRLFQEHADLVRPVRSGADIEAASAEGRVGVILGAQNCSPIDEELGLVEVMNDAGLKIMQLTYNNISLCGGGCYEPVDPGVTRFGREVIREMNRVGMVVDLSHSGERTTLEAIEVSERPVAITHGNPFSFHDVPRNKSDDVLKQLADSGGMLGFSLYAPHLPGGGGCSLEDFCAMVARTAELIGTRHMGIGSDLCLGWGGETLGWMRNGRWRFAGEADRRELEAKGWPRQPAWFRSPADTPRLAQGLRDAGFAAEDVDRIMGGNWLDFFRDGFNPQNAAPRGEDHLKTLVSQGR